MVRVKVMLDTNFLLTMIRQKIHGLEEIKSKIPADFYTLSRVLYEINGLSKDNKKIANESKLVEQVLKNNGVKVIDSTMQDVDTELVKLSKEYVIATNDKLLRQRVKKAGGKTIFIRSLTYIDTEEVIGE